MNVLSIKSRFFLSVLLLTALGTRRMRNRKKDGKTTPRSGHSFAISHRTVQDKMERNSLRFVSGDLKADRFKGLKWGKVT